MTIPPAPDPADQSTDRGLGREFPRWYQIGLLEQVYTTSHRIFQMSQRGRSGIAKTLRHAELKVLFRRLGEVEDPLLGHKIWQQELADFYDALDAVETLQLASWLTTYAHPLFSSYLHEKAVSDPVKVLDITHSNYPQLFDWMASKCEGPGTVTCYGDVYTKQVSIKKWGLPIIAARSLGIDVRLSELARTKLYSHIHANRQHFGTRDCARVAGKLIEVALLDPRD